MPSQVPAASEIMNGLIPYNTLASLRMFLICSGLPNAAVLTAWDQGTRDDPSANAALISVHDDPILPTALPSLLIVLTF